MNKFINTTSFVLGVATGVLALVFASDTFGDGARNACQDIAGAECELRWVPLTHQETSE